MAQDDVLAKAKSTLAGANKLSSEADPAGRFKVKPIATPINTPKEPVSAKAGAGLGAELKAKQDNVMEYAGAIPKYHKGGVVKETGPAMLEKGETVRTKEQEKAMSDEKEPKSEKVAEAKDPKAEKKEKKASPAALMTSEDKAPKAKSEKKGKGDEYSQTVIDHYTGGGKQTHHTHHKHKSNPDKDIHYASQDMAGVHAGLDQHVGNGTGAAMEAPEPMPNAEQAQAAATPPPAAAGAMPQQV